MDTFLVYMPLISVAIVAGLFIMALVNFSTIRKSMQVQSEQQIRNLKAQSEQQIYSRIMDARLKLESTETFTNMAKESPIFAERFTVVDSPDEYYIIVAFLDLFEFLFRLNKRDIIDNEIWSRGKGLAKTIIQYPNLREYGTRQRMSTHMNSEILLIRSTIFPETFYTYSHQRSSNVYSTISLQGSSVYIRATI